MLFLTHGREGIVFISAVYGGTIFASRFPLAIELV
jgi:hypothetical protein